VALSHMEPAIRAHSPFCKATRAKCRLPNCSRYTASRARIVAGSTTRSPSTRTAPSFILRIASLVLAARCTCTNS